MQRVVIISDLHLCVGRDCNVEDFYADTAFERLLQNRLLTPGPEDRVDLVLLGDTFDLWQTALDDSEYTAKSSSQIPLAYLPHDEAQRLDRVSQAHPRFFLALREFGDRQNCYVTQVIGNHDHSLIETRVVQPKARQLMGVNVQFTPNFDRPEMGLYAEHGGQWEKSNAYDDFQHFGFDGECAGYAFVRLFWNRLETIEPRLDDELPREWARMWSHLVGLARSIPRILIPAIRYWKQYRSDPRVKQRVGPLKAAGPELSSLPGNDGPDILVSGEVRADRAFSEDATVEQALREAYYAYPEFKAAVDEMRPADAPPVPPAAEQVEKAMEGKWFGARLAGHEGAEQLFELSPTGRDQPLDGDTYRYVVFGHTHDAGELRLENGALYVNTGTWAGRDRNEFPLVVTEWDGRATRLGLGVFADGQVDVNWQ